MRKMTLVVQIQMNIVVQGMSIRTTSQRISSTHSLIKFVVIFLLSWQAMFRISNIAVDVLFKFIGVLLHKFGEFTDSIKLKQFADFFLIQC